MDFYWGIDVGGMSIKGGVVSKDGQIIYKTVSKINLDALSSLDAVASDLNNYCISSGIKVNKCGIGVPCIFDKKTGTVSYGNNLDFKGVNLKERFYSLYQKELFISNDASAAALGESKFGAGRGYKNSVLITIGTGVGCGIIVDGKIISSNSSAVGELSHTVVSVNGRKCSCGNKGCLEAYCSMTALYKDVKREMLRNRDCSLWNFLDAYNVDGKKFFSLLGKDETADKVFDRFIKYLGIGVLNVANLLRPDIIIIGGGVSAQGKVIIDPLNQYLNKNLFAKEYTEIIPVVAAQNQNDAGILGAAALTM